MSGPAIWFIGLSVVSAVSLLLGCWWGRRSPWRGWGMVAVGLVCLCICSWLGRHPATAANYISVGSLQYFEGTAAVPFFMLILGVGWTHANKFRQRGFVGVGVVVGVVFFLQGSLWMVTSTPAHMFNETQTTHMVVMQSQ